MAWNEPGNNRDKPDPWTGKSNQAGPPDLEAALAKLRQQLFGLLGKSGKVTPPRKPGATGLSLGLGLIAAVIGLIWLVSGIFIIGPAEQAVILRFGKYLETLGPGPHWIPRLVDSAYVVNEEKISTYVYDSQMLTKDANIVNITLAIQYRINNARDYLFNVVRPDESLKQATASALRQVSGNTILNDLLTSGREQVRQQVQAILTQTLLRYQSGILVTDVAIQNASPPEAVKEAFDDAIKAQEDEKRFQNQAQAYANQVEAIAQGQAQRLLADAKAYKEQVVLKAQGDVAMFLALLPHYQQATVVTKERLYLDMMEDVLSKTSKILVDTNGSNNLIYLPLDKVLGATAKANVTPPLAASSTLAEPSAATTTANTVVNPNNSIASSYLIKGGY